MRALRGAPVDDFLAEMASIIGTRDEPMVLAEIGMVKTFDAFAGGRLRDAREAAHRTGELVAEYLPLLQAIAARAALWTGASDDAADDLAALDASGVHGPAIAADRRTIQAGIAALDGRAAESLGLYREALRAWRDLGLAWDEALCGLDMATVLDPSEPEVAGAAEVARETFVRLGAKPFIVRLDAAVTRDTGTRASTGTGAVTTAEMPAAPTS
jgi:hypothetical protein